MVFEENHDPIIITLINDKKEEFELKSKMIKAKDIKEIEIIGNSKNKDYKYGIDKVYKMLNIIFGKDEEFFSQFSMDLLNKVIEYTLDENKKKFQKPSG